MCSVWQLRRNFFVLVVNMTICSFINYLSNFQMTEVKGNMITNLICLQCAAIAGGLLGGVVYALLGPKLGMIISYAFTLVGAFLLYWYVNDDSLIFLFIIILNFGINVAFQMVYIIGVKIIPTIFAARAFGVTNVAARTFTILSPLMA